MKIFQLLIQKKQGDEFVVHGTYSMMGDAWEERDRLFDTMPQGSIYDMKIVEVE
jgi:hypothetical protein